MIAPSHPARRHFRFRFVTLWTNNRLILGGPEIGAYSVYLMTLWPRRWLKETDSKDEDQKAVSRNLRQC
jgi:hypothetical protein